MSPALHYLSASIALFVACELCLGIWYGRRKRYYAKVARTERIRLKVGDARCRLVQAAARGELGHQTVTFHELYFIQTSLMRGTDHYPALSEAMWRKVLRFEQAKQSAMESEAATWTPEVRKIATQTAAAIRDIWIEYVPFRMLLHILKAALLKVGLINYQRIERWYDEVLSMMDNGFRQFARLMTLAMLGAVSENAGSHVRLAIEMRRTEQLIVQAAARRVA